jgi:hypothetical protein
MAAMTPAGAAKLLVALFLLSSILSGSLATSYHRRVHAGIQTKTLSRRQNTTEPILPVLGLPGLGITTVYPRLEIRELQRSPDQFNVYLIGLRGFQNTSQDDKLSYFQIAGMHGLDGAKHDVALTVRRHPWSTISSVGWSTGTRGPQRRLLRAQQQSVSNLAPTVSCSD